MRTGFKDEAEEVMKNNLQDILAANEKTILVSCSGLLQHLKK